MLLCVPIMLFAAADNETKHKAVWGRKSKGCDSGNGICVVREVTSEASQMTFAVSDAGQFYIKINKDEIAFNQPDAYEQLSGAETFKFEEETILPIEITVPLGLQEDYTIAVGEYPLTDNGKEFVIDIMEEGMSSR